MGSSLLLKGGTSTPKSIVETITASHSFAVGDVVRYDVATSLWSKSQANSAENSEVAGVVSTVTATSFDVTYSGYISIASLAGITSPVLFLDSTAAGGLTASPPSAIGMVVKPVLTKTTNGSGYIVSNYLGTQIGGSSTVAIDEIQPVGTIMPFAGSVIPDSWLECNGASYAVSAYPNLYAKLQYSGGDRAPAYGYVANITVGNSTAYATGQSVSQTATGLSGTVLALSTAPAASGVITLTVQVIPTYSTTNKNFVQPNAVFSNAAVTIGSISSSISAVSVTHFNTPDLRGRFAIGANTTAIGELETDSTNNSAILGIYSLASEGGQESTIAGTGILTGTNAYVTSTAASGGLVANMPPYTVVRYIIKATPYTRAAIIDGIDIPYTSLLVGDLRDGSLRPGGSGEDLLFKTNDGTSGVERMRLTNDGKLGIGTTTPQYKFVVSNSGAEGFEFIPALSLNENIIQSYNRSTNVFNTLDFRASNYKIRASNTEVISINSSGQVNIAATTESTSISTGGLTLGGGLGMAKNLTVGGGISAAGGITFSGLTRVTNTTASTSTTTGALTVTGGAGIAGALYVGGITTAGGITMGGALTVGGAARVNSTAASTSTTTGALVVSGGVGIAGGLNVGGGITLGTSQLAVPSGNAPIFGARAWGLATIASTTSVSLTSAGNIASVSISGTELTFIFNTATQMPDVNYAVSIMGSSTGGGSFVYKVKSQSVGSFTIEVNKRADNANAFGSGECQKVYVVVYR